MSTSFFGPVSSFFLYLLLANTVALSGLVANSSTMLIGSMLLAPFLAPVISMNNHKSVENVLKMVFVLGLGVALSVGMGYGAVKLLNYNEETKEMKDRAEWENQSRNTQLAYLTIPIVTGISFAIAYDHADIIPMTGVGIAVSILPPLANAGIYLGQGKKEEAKKSLKLGMLNLTLVLVSYTLVRQLFLKRINKIYNAYFRKYKGTPLNPFKSEL